MFGLETFHIVFIAVALVFAVIGYFINKAYFKRNPGAMAHVNNEGFRSVLDDPCQFPTGTIESRDSRWD